MKKIILILGMHRSGTSVVTQICQKMGAYLGESNELMSATKDNPDGYFENKEIYNTNEEILHLCNWEWYTLGKLDINTSCPQIVKRAGNIKKCLQKLLNKSDIVAIKDPRISIMLPLWERILDELEVEVQYVWVYRNPLEVAESLRKRDGYSTKHSLWLWSYYNLSILKFLNKKKYLLINYRDILENHRVVEDLSRLFEKKSEKDIGYRLEKIVKTRYCHSDYPDQVVLNMKKELASDLYGTLLKNKEVDINVPDFENRYIKEITNAKKRYLDYEVLERTKYLEKKELLIYGAGNYGKQAAEMLQELGLFQYNFCDRDIYKYGKKFMGGKVFSIREIENRENLCIIIAIENETLRREIEQTLSCMKDVYFLSFFALKTVWKYTMYGDNEFSCKVKMYTLWYEQLAFRGKDIMNACKCPVLVYQSGKVGSLTVSRSLREAGTENAHIHRFFFKKDIVGELLLGKEQKTFIKNSNMLQFRTPEYAEYIKNAMKGKKIITMVRDPLAVDLSTVFQWFGSGVADRYIAVQLRQGKVFEQVVSELMVRIQDRLFQWFDEELKELSGIDIFAYPFDKEKGYVWIKEDNVEILLMKAEKLSQMTEVIRKFTGNQRLELKNQNVGKDKDYAYIYEEVKNKLEIPREYLEHYYRNNLYVDHFYTEEEKKSFRVKWLKNVKNGESVNG